MRKIKYYYNTHTLRFEKLVTPFRVKLLRIFGFIASSLFAAFIIVVIAFEYIDSPEEKILKNENDVLKQDYAVINARINDLQKQMLELQTRDNNVYRAIFEAAPIPDSARIEEIEKLHELQYVQTLGESQLVKTLATQLNLLSARVAYQAKSYEEIDQMLKNKEKLLAGIPAIQPVANKDLRRVASGFGYRVDPVYKVTKFHAGLDFTAPQGTPIYATADGTIKTAGASSGGYGNHVVINHGYGYETLYWPHGEG
jgi:murein DD-endopeptidase MepM/ murein hydrolase activator NlpD